MKYATCAVCLRPIVTRDDIRVSGTEIMHRSCAAAGRETVGWRTQREVADLRAQLAQAQGGADRERGSAVRARATVREVERLLVAANSERDLAQEAQVKAADAMAKLLRERDAALAELARYPVQPNVTSNPDEDVRDGAEQRFSLLELD
jgi:ribosome-binding protein aMBF1 (putative translation factor)